MKETLGFYNLENLIFCLILLSTLLSAAQNFYNENLFFPFYDLGRALTLPLFINKYIMKASHKEINVVFIT